jgi:hypothetical protein
MRKSVKSALYYRIVFSPLPIARIELAASFLCAHCALCGFANIT